MWQDFLRFKEVHVKEHHELEKRLIQTQHHDQEVDKRLSEGAAAFQDVRKSIGDLAGIINPKPMSAWKILGGVFGIATVIGGFIWQAARYPDREEFNQTTSRLQEIEKKQASIEATVSTTNRTIRNVDNQQDQINEKLDALVKKRGR